MPNPQNKITWYPDEIVYLIQHGGSLASREMLSHINQNRSNPVCLHSLRLKLYELGIKKCDKPAEWFERESSFLLNNYQKMGNVEMCRYLNNYENRSRLFTPKIIWKKMQLLNLRRSENSLAEIKSKNIALGAYAVNHYKCADARRYPDGKKVFQKHGDYKYWKIKQGSKMVFLHRLLWEQHHGPVPKGFKIYYKDCNTRNCRIENLICLKSHRRPYKKTYDGLDVFLTADKLAKKPSVVQSHAFRMPSFNTCD